MQSTFNLIILYQLEQLEDSLIFLISYYLALLRVHGEVAIDSHDSLKVSQSLNADYSKY